MIMKRSHIQGIDGSSERDGELKEGWRAEDRELTDQTSTVCQVLDNSLPPTIHTSLGLPPLVYGCLSILSLDSLC